MKFNPVLFFALFISMITLVSCNNKSSNLQEQSSPQLEIPKPKYNFDANILWSFQFYPVGGQEVLPTNGEREIIKTKYIKDTFEIDVYKWIAAGQNNGACKLKSDTLFLYHWEEIKEEDKDKDHIALILKSQLKYKLKKIDYNVIKVERLPDQYIK